MRWIKEISYYGGFVQQNQFRLEIFTAQCNRVITLQRQAKMQYFHSPISKNSNPAVPWKTPRSIVPSSVYLSIKSYLLHIASMPTVSLSSPSDEPMTVSPPSYNPPPPRLSFKPVSTQWCEESLSNIKPSHCPGMHMDGIPSVGLQAASSSLSGTLCCILNSSIVFSTFYLA